MLRKEGARSHRMGKGIKEHGVGRQWSALHRGSQHTAYSERCWHQDRVCPHGRRRDVLLADSSGCPDAFILEGGRPPPWGAGFCSGFVCASHLSCGFATGMQIGCR